MIAEVHRREKHALARFEFADAFAGFYDLSGDVAAENVRQVHARQTLAHPQIKVVQRTGFNANQYMVFSKDWVRDVLIRQNFWAAKLMNAYCLHKSLQPSNPTQKRNT
jgi:hypothetical protein